MAIKVRLVIGGIFLAIAALATISGISHSTMTLNSQRFCRQTGDITLCDRIVRQTG